MALVETGVSPKEVGVGKLQESVILLLVQEGMDEAGKAGF